MWVNTFFFFFFFSFFATTYLHDPVMLHLYFLRFRSDPSLAAKIKKMEEGVLNESIAPGTASDILVDTFLNSKKTS